MTELNPNDQIIEDANEQTISDPLSDNGIELKKEKNKPKKAYEFTEKRKQAYMKMIEKKQEYQEKKRKEKEMGKAVKEPIAKTLNKIQKLKEKARMQGFEVEDEPVKVKVPPKKLASLPTTPENSDNDEQLVQLKRKSKPKKVIYQDYESSSEEEVVVVRKPKVKAKREAPVVEQKPYTITFI